MEGHQRQPETALLAAPQLIPGTALGMSGVVAPSERIVLGGIGIGNRGSRELDEVTLKQIAQITGGRYFRAYNTSDLQQIYVLLDQLEPVEKDVKSYRPIKALFYIPLTASFALAALLALLVHRPQLHLTGFLRGRPRSNVTDG